MGDEIPLRGFGRETHGNVQICLGNAYAFVMPSFFISRKGVLGKKLQFLTNFLSEIKSRDVQVVETRNTRITETVVETMRSRLPVKFTHK